ncbi:glycerophosphodiester phosphodiesterase [Streptomyces sp. SAJ15]|uniref:glycerophosphodiester phosphodiesterase n=1 Tax=Streptomyces sp. SAJ15 TaxID=2011095 RepID=UPI0011868D52|nr:glycerophosphodiester phosphodiesterase [Streptomyces sp. SAJ15]TVL89969.1 glycerophosphodiester phosphodiesterase [Streptomyces sp. SAJ15]
MVARSLLAGAVMLALSLPIIGPAAPIQRERQRGRQLEVERAHDHRARRAPGHSSRSLPALPRITYTAHRGGALEVPENSMAGLTTAFVRGEAQVLDFDSRVLRDGTPVVMHDATLDRTTFQSGPVNRLTLPQWRRVILRPDPSLPSDWAPEAPPTVAEVLDRFGGRRRLMIEAKDPVGLPRLAELVKERRLTRSVFVNTNSPEVAREAAGLGLMAQLWRSAAQLREDDPAAWRGFVELLDVDHRARERDLRRALRSGIPRVWAHTVNTPAARDRMLALGCDGIITDAPGLLTHTPVAARYRTTGG